MTDSYGEHFVHGADSITGGPGGSHSGGPDGSHSGGPGGSRSGGPDGSHSGSPHTGDVGGPHTGDIGIDSLGVHTGEIRAHANHVSQVQETASIAVDAVRQVTPGGWDNAYGLMNQFFPLALRPLADLAGQVIQQTSDALSSTEEELLKSAAVYDHVEHSVTQQHQAILDELNALNRTVRGTLDNPLVDPDSQFNPQEYGPDPQELANGHYGSLSPITSGGNWLSGTGLWADCYQLGTDIKSRNWVQVSFDATAVGMETLGTIQDPIGTALSILTGWMIDHLKPLRLLLDELAGNPGTIQGVADSWRRIYVALNDAAHRYAGAVQQDLANWKGQAADAYRGHAGKLVQALGSASSIADALSALITICGQLVAACRSAVRDIIANLVGELTSDAIQEACTFGAATPAVVGEVTGAIEREAGVATKLVESLVKMLKDASFIAGKIDTLINEIVKIIQILHRLGKEVSSGHPQPS